MKAKIQLVDLVLGSKELVQEFEGNEKEIIAHLKLLQESFTEDEKVQIHHGVTRDLVEYIQAECESDFSYVAFLA